MSDPSILLDAFQQKPAAAIAYFQKKGLKVTTDWFKMWKNDHAESFTVAHAASLDLLKDIRAMVDKALTDGITLAQFKKELTPTLKAKGWWGKKQEVNEETGEITAEYLAGSPRRLRRIYETNLQTSYMAGRYKGQMDAADDLPYLQYIAVIDGRTSDQCRDMHLRVFRADDPVWNEFYPPNHWGCRARVRSLSERQLQRMGLTPEPPTTKKSFESKHVIVGKGDNADKREVKGLKLGNGKTFWAGAGWNHNPGTSMWMPELDGYNDHDASAFIRDLLASPAYKMWLGAEGKIDGVIPVAVIPDAYTKAVGGEKRVVRLTSNNYKKHRRTGARRHYHKDIGVEDYQALQSIIEGADLVVTDNKNGGAFNTLLFVRETADADFYVVPVRPDDDGRPEMRSLYRESKVEVDRYRKEAVNGINGRRLIK